MQHSHFNSHARPEPEQWVERLCITDSADDRHLLASIIENIRASDIDRHTHDHPCSLWVADTLSGMKVDQATILATMYADIRVQERYPLERITAECSESVSNLVKNVHSLFRQWDIVSGVDGIEITQALQSPGEYNQYSPNIVDHC